MTWASAPRRLGALIVLATTLPFASLAAPLDGPAPVPRTQDGPAQFVDAALRDAAAALATPAEATAPTRAEQLHAVFTRYFDIAQLGRNSVGAAWLLVGEAQQMKFLASFESFLITGYCGALVQPGALAFGPARVVETAAAAPADGTGPTPTGAPPTGPTPNGPTVVRVEARGSEGDVHPVLLTLDRRTGGDYRIVDVSTESISLGRVLAADFGSVLRHNGGRIEALANALQDKVDARARGR